MAGRVEEKENKEEHVRIANWQDIFNDIRAISRTSYVRQNLISSNKASFVAKPIAFSLEQIFRNLLKFSEACPNFFVFGRESIRTEGNR